jgi:uncharacterized protein (TIGR02391 family)
MSRATSSAHHLSPKGLHTRLGAAWPAFEHGDYDSAVFQAMKAVEVTVREVAGLSPSLLRVTLMRKAFHPDFGRLSDFKTQHGERQARSDLFAGAIGSFKNPHSHRDVLLDNPAEAAELMLLANHLLRITDASAARRFVSLVPLTPQEERILRMYFGIGMQAKHSLEQIGIQFSMARKDVQEILHKALQELEHRSVYNELTGALANTDLKDMQGLLDMLEQSQLGLQVSSWLANGKNLPIKHDQLCAALGNDRVEALTAYFGLPVKEMLETTAENLPDIVDKLSPKGKLQPLWLGYWPNTCM